jgi:glycosyltransferase involved in cell wall biosynthesis
MALGTRHDIERMLAATDIFVMPSHREGFCNSLLEAGAMALPSITYDICGCNDSVDNSTGILVPPYDEGALHDAMVQLLEDPDRCERLGQAARERMEQRFDRTVVHQALHDYYHQILGE